MQSLEERIEKNVRLANNKMLSCKIVGEKSAGILFTINPSIIRSFSHILGEYQQRPSTKFNQSSCVPNDIFTVLLQL